MEGQLNERGLNTPQQLSRNLEINANEGENQELPPLVPPGFKSICNEQGFLDEENVDDLPIKLDSLTPESSQCTMNNILLRSSTLWRLTEIMEVLRKVPQQPHFRPLEKFLPELREGRAYGRMVAYASLVDSVNKSSIEDTIASFEGKISALAHFQENGFDVESLHHILNKLLETKLDHNKHVVHLDKLKESVPEKESLLNEKEKKLHFSLSRSLSPFVLKQSSLQRSSSG